MSYLENDLKAALRREEPAADFIDRVLAQLQRPAPSQPSWWEALAVLMRPPRLPWAVLSMILSVMIPVAGVQYRKELRYRAEGERAKKELLFAVQVAGSRLHHAQKRVLEAGRMDTRL